MLRAATAQTRQQGQRPVMSLSTFGPCEISPAAGESTDCFYKDLVCEELCLLMGKIGGFFFK